MRWASLGIFLLLSLTERCFRSNTPDGSSLMERSCGVSRLSCSDDCRIARKDIQGHWRNQASSFFDGKYLNPLL
jgi:hypothetical protein